VARFIGAADGLFCPRRNAAAESIGGDVRGQPAAPSRTVSWAWPGIRVVILYPSKRISEAQEKQFTTLGENITALEVAGTFDDCQRLVKQAFSDAELNNRAWLTSGKLHQHRTSLAADVLSRGGLPAVAGGFGAANRFFLCPAETSAILRLGSSPSASACRSQNTWPPQTPMMLCRNICELGNFTHGRRKQPFRMPWTWATQTIFPRLLDLCRNRPRIRPKGNLGSRSYGRRNARRDEDAP